MAVDSDESDSLELQHVVRFVIVDARLGVPGDVAVHRPKSDGDVLVGRNPVDDIDRTFSDDFDVLARELERVASVTDGAEPFQPNALTVRRYVIGFNENGSTDWNLTSSALLVRV